MKVRNYILILSLILVIISPQVFSQDSDLFKVKLRKDNNEKLILYDTIISLDFLTQETKRYKGIYNFEFFQCFNYQELNCQNMSNNELLISNDSIKIRLLAKPFDTLRIIQNLKTDTNYYLKHSFYGLGELNITDLNKLHRKPQTELNLISIQINNNKVDISNEHYENFFDPNIICDKEFCPTNAYLTENGKIILQMDNGDGTGFYYAIFVFNRKGELINKVVKNVI